MRLRTVSCHDEGWRRVRRGRGFSYLDARGEPLEPEDVERVRGLAIPPAWTDVWICPHPRGHLQAVGVDEAGRRQYLYHPQWREQRDLVKFERVTALGAALPRMRRRIRGELRAAPGDQEIERRRILAAGARLLDLGCFRPGSDGSAEEFGSRGLTTLQRRHVRIRAGTLTFDFVGKSGIEHEVRVEDELVAAVLTSVRRPPRARLLASQVDGRWRPVTPEELNDQIRGLTGVEATAKDFRTWHATVAVAVALASGGWPSTTRARRRRIREAIVEASELLGNTPTVARSSYVDPRVIDLFETGTLLSPVPRSRDAVDRAVAELLGHRHRRLRATSSGT